MRQAFSPDFWPRTQGLVPRPVLVEIVEDKLALWQVFLPVPLFSSASIIPPVIHTHSSFIHLPPNHILYITGLVWVCHISVPWEVHAESEETFDHPSYKTTSYEPFMYWTAIIFRRYSTAPFLSVILRGNYAIISFVRVPPSSRRPTTWHYMLCDQLFLSALRVAHRELGCDKPMVLYTVENCVPSDVRTETEERVEHAGWDRRKSWACPLRQKKELRIRTETEEIVENTRWDRKKNW